MARSQRFLSLTSVNGARWHPIPGTTHARLPTPVGGRGVSPVPRADKVVLSSKWFIGMGVRHTMNIFGMAPFGFNTESAITVPGLTPRFSTGLEGRDILGFSECPSVRRNYAPNWISGVG
jgi:hypothetical protein